MVNSAGRSRGLIITQTSQVVLFLYLVALLSKPVGVYWGSCTFCTPFYIAPWWLQMSESLKTECQSFRGVDGGILNVNEENSASICSFHII